MMGRSGHIGAVATYLKRPALRAAAIACIGWGFVIGPNDGAAAEKLRVGVNLTTIETVPIYLAAEGLDVELTGGAIPSLTDGKVDVVTNAETQAILRSTARPDIRVILTVAEYGYRIIARRSAGVGAASDLRGRKIATSLNSSAHFYIVKTLRGVGLSEKDVTVVGMPPNDMPAALARGDVDAVSIWEPAAERSVRALGADGVVIAGPAYRERFNLNTTTAVLADPGKRAALVDLLRRIVRASKDIRDRPEPAQQLMAKSSTCRCRSCRPCGACSNFRRRSGRTCSTPCSSRSPGWPRSRTAHRARARRSRG
jgi:ABC-type nitrate/sulfonate/bicarbonate transport system substrate-binding protein